MKNTKETKLKAVKEHIYEKTTIKVICNKYGIDPARLKYYVALYHRYGEKPFLDKKEGQRDYPRTLKLQMIKRYLAGESGYSLALEMGCTNQTIVRDWTKVYQNKGEQAVVGSKSRKNYLLKNERQRLKDQKRIIERNKYLEAENEILKKWYSLTQKRSEKSK